ncbi:hypothetical protein FGO68_gene17176 [Halteria grandinella]|uniref:Uncharacterized protein n=1 Tax=Halteria grandinella TaxID=5974 RepID=A0A8J8NWL4_HALGN|nr:hypothetical protein FGO68_gene17176 [Halteria grandinella]
MNQNNSPYLNQTQNSYFLGGSHRRHTLVPISNHNSEFETTRKPQVVSTRQIKEKLIIMNKHIGGVLESQLINATSSALTLAEKLQDQRDKELINQVLTHSQPLIQDREYLEGEKREGKLRRAHKGSTVSINLQKEVMNEGQRMELKIFDDEVSPHERQVEEDAISSYINKLSKRDKREPGDKPKRPLYDTLNTTFYTQPESIFGEFQHQIPIKNTGKSQNHSKQHTRRDQRIDQLQQSAIQEKAFVVKTNEVNQALSMIESSKNAKELLNIALQSVHKGNLVKAAEKSRVYQKQVRDRIKVKKVLSEREEEVNVKFIASMLPSALEMHKFTNIMTKDKAFSNDRNFKVVSAIRTYKDSERLEYLLNNKLSAI